MSERVFFRSCLCVSSVKTLIPYLNATPRFSSSIFQLVLLGDNSSSDSQRMRTPKELDHSHYLQARLFMISQPRREKTLFDAVPPTTIDLGIGAPSADLLPVEMMLTAATKALSATDAWKSLQYGPEVGDSEILDVLAEWLSAQYGDQVHSHHLSITSGASQSLQTLLTLFTSPRTVTTHAFFQDPTYHLAFQTFLDVGFTTSQFIGVPEDVHGLDINWLESFLSSLPAPSVQTPFFSRVLYLVPTHSNPSTITLSAARRRALVNLSHKFGLLVICDDVYDLLSFDPCLPPPRRLVAYDLDSLHPITGGTILSNNTFSKILGPGIRCGWVECSLSLRARIKSGGSAVSGGSPAHLTSHLLTQLLSPLQTAPLTTHLSHLRSELKKRLNSLVHALEKYVVPLGGRFVVPKGGYFVWVRLPLGIEGPALEEAVLKSGVGIGSGQKFSVRMRWGEDQSGKYMAEAFIRVCFAFYGEDKLEEGVRRLGETMRRIIESG